MKALIWIGCFILHYIFAEIIDNVGSIILDTGIVAGDEGAILYATIIAVLKTVLLGVALWLAKRLCKLWDKHKKTNKDKQTQAEIEHSKGEQTMKYQERPSKKASLSFYLDNQKMEEQKEQPKQEAITETHNDVSKEDTESPPSRDTYSLPFSKRITSIFSICFKIFG